MVLLIICNPTLNLHLILVCRLSKIRLGIGESPVVKSTYALPEDSSSSLSTYIRQLRGSDTSGLLKKTCKHTHTNIFK